MNFRDFLEKNDPDKSKRIKLAKRASVANQVSRASATWTESPLANLSDSNGKRPCSFFVPTI